MKLFMVHCGYYDKEVADGVYESHVNFFVVAESFEEARTNAKELAEFKRKQMHVDGMQEIIAVGGHQIRVGERDPKLEGQTRLLNYRPRGHAPVPAKLLSPGEY
jgi:hypothetical protein